ncbi:arf GTPase activating protein drongo isoform X2 [Musca autumnalis]|uniref:arf GTPase activating protein drongo isoform X2 n=1 Tax=Musca autumnalis TaxID=221902 RepID=UPI003CF5CD39
MRRGLTPPHRVKSISMATFTQEEIDFLKAHGNDVCAKTWLGLWDPKRAVHQDQRELMIDKYERKRYYLEPASPLKSLTNATNLKTSSAAGATTATSTPSSAVSTSNNNRNSSNSNNNSTQNNNNNNHHTHIQLTPPTSQRTTANGLHKSSSSAISRPHHSGNSGSNNNNNHTSLQNGFNTDAFGLHNGLNLSVGSASTGALSDTSSCASANGFGAEADFVADFGSADIFNATVASSPASSVGSASTTNNGYAKIQPLKASGNGGATTAISAQQQFMNGFSTTTSNGNTENFADFDHAPIYNAAGQPPANPLADINEEPNYQFVRKNAVRKKSLRSDSLTIKPNERQLKDILEMDNPLQYDNDDRQKQQQQQQQDYIQFTPNDAYQKATNDFNSILEDFERFLTMNGHKYAGMEEEQQQQKGDFDAMMMMAAQQKQSASVTSTTSKFTPLALAAHATAMAVLGNQNHFNTPAPPTTTSSTNNNNSSNIMASRDTSLNAQWDVWSSVDGTGIANTSSGNQQQQQQQQYQQHNRTPAAWQTTTSLFDIKEQQQQPYQQQQSMGMSLFSSSTSANILNPSNTNTTTTSYFATQPTITNLVSASATSTLKSGNITTTNTTSMSNSNPFRMHLDVVCDDDNNTKPISLFSNNNSNNNNNNNSLNSQFPSSSSFCIATTNTNNFNFVKNSNSTFDLFDDVNSSSSCFANNNNFHINCNTSSNNTNPFSPATTPPPTPTSFPETSSTYSATSIPSVYDDPFSTDHILQQHPNLLSLFPSITSPSSQSSSSTFACNNVVVVDDDDENANQIPNLFNSNPTSTDCLKSQLEVAIAAAADANNNISNRTIPISIVSNESLASSSSIITTSTFSSTTTTNNHYNSNNHIFSNNKNDYNNNNNNNNINNCWRLPMSNGITINKNSTTNGFNNNNNNSNVSTSPAAPAADRYAALKDLDEQLRESKAVAAHAASIVTANVVESGFGNPTNGTVNPFAAHTPAVVANPFQNNGNAPNATQLFGQMTLIPNGMANGFLNGQKSQANVGFFNYTANGFANTNNNNNNASNMPTTAAIATPGGVTIGAAAATMYTTGIPNGCGFGFGAMHQQQQIAATGAGLTGNAFNNPFAASGALNSNNPFL